MPDDGAQRFGGSGDVIKILRCAERYGLRGRRLVKADSRSSSVLFVKRHYEKPACRGHMMCPMGKWRSETLLISMFVLAMTGCVSFPARMGNHLGVPAPATQPRPGTLWIDRVVIDYLPSAELADALQDSWTLHLAEYLRSRRLFEQARLLPGSPAATDTIIHIRFTRYEQEYHIAPGYFPWAILTATFYIWFGGTIMVEQAQYRATMTVEHGDGIREAEVSIEDSKKMNISIYNTGPLDYGPIRAAFLQRLLEKAFPVSAAAAVQP